MAILRREALDLAPRGDAARRQPRRACACNPKGVADPRWLAASDTARRYSRGRSYDAGGSLGERLPRAIPERQSRSGQERRPGGSAAMQDHDAADRLAFVLDHFEIGV